MNSTEKSGCWRETHGDLSHEHLTGGGRRRRGRSPPAPTLSRCKCVMLPKRAVRARNTSVSVGHWPQADAQTQAGAFPPRTRPLKMQMRDASEARRSRKKHQRFCWPLAASGCVVSAPPWRRRGAAHQHFCCPVAASGGVVSAPPWRRRGTAHQHFCCPMAASWGVVSAPPWRRGGAAHQHFWYPLAAPGPGIGAQIASRWIRGNSKCGTAFPASK